MLIPSTLFLILSITICLAVAVGLVLFFKIKYNNYYGVVGALVVSAFLWAFFQMSFSQVYIVKPNRQVKSYRVISTFTYSLTNGGKVPVSVGTREIQIINNSDTWLVLEKILYSRKDMRRQREVLDSLFQTQSKGVIGSGTEDKMGFIPPYESFTLELPQNRIHYLFDDEIPYTVKSYGSSGIEEKYWLHERN